MNIKINKPLVSVNWLYQNLDATNLLILDGTLPKVSAVEPPSLTEKKQLINARFFDLKGVFSVQDAPFPNTCLASTKFEKEARKIGVKNNSAIVVYDDYGIYSSARVWWLFKLMGFNNIAVLDGGLPSWENAGYQTEKPRNINFSVGNFKANYNPILIKQSKGVFDAIDNLASLTLDARSEGRFLSKEPEPREEVRSGRIPNSNSMPYTSLLDDNRMKSVEELNDIFKKNNQDSKEMIFTCGSGITACVLALGAEIIGIKNYSVYDGSWTEWGSLAHLPVAK